MDNAQVGTGASLSQTFTNGDKVKLEVTSSEACVTNAKATSNEITISTTPSVTPTVAISVDQNNICEGTTQVLSVSSSSDLGTPISWYIQLVYNISRNKNAAMDVAPTP